jgi:hypothetical protein
MIMSRSYRIAAFLAVALFGLPPSQQVHAGNRANGGSSGGGPGFYVELDRCHACAYPGWQLMTIQALDKSGPKAWVSDVLGAHRTGRPYETVEDLPMRKVRREESWMVNVFAGPFDSAEGAKKFIGRLPAILRSNESRLVQQNSAWAQDFAVDDRQQLASCAGNHCDLFGFFVNLIKVGGETGASDRPRGPK